MSVACVEGARRERTGSMGITNIGLSVGGDGTVKVDRVHTDALNPRVVKSATLPPFLCVGDVIVTAHNTEQVAAMFEAVAEWVEVMDEWTCSNANQ